MDIPPSQSLRRAEVAVVTVVRNQRAWIDECAASVLAQAGADFVWVAVDDASEDGTAKRLENWARQDRRVLLLRQTRQQQQVKGMLRALAAVDAPYAALLDGDDVAMPGRLERSLAQLRTNPRCVAVYGEAEFIDAQGRAMPPWFIARDAGALRRIAEFFMPAIHSSGCWRTAPLQRALAEISTLAECLAHDYYLLLRGLDEGEVGFLAEPVVRYRIQPTSLTQTRPLQQFITGGAFGLHAALRRAGRPADLAALLAWAYEEVDDADPSLAGLGEALARKALELGLPRLALYHARRAVRAGRWTATGAAFASLGLGWREWRSLWPVLTGGLLNGADVDGTGRSRQ